MNFIEATNLADIIVIIIKQGNCNQSRIMTDPFTSVRAARRIVVTSCMSNAKKSKYQIRNIDLSGSQNVGCKRQCSAVKEREREGKGLASIFCASKVDQR